MRSRATSRRPEQRTRFLEQLAQTYERRRAAAGWPELRAIRFYSEVWNIRLDLAGIDRPERTLTDVAYFPPGGSRPALESRGLRRSRSAGDVMVPTEDVLFELGAEGCREACSALDDRYASGTKAVRLQPDSGEPASWAARIAVPAGRWFVYVRMRTGARSGHDHLTVELDRAEIAGAKDGLGTLETISRRRGGCGRVFAGYPPLVLKLAGSSTHVLELSADAPIDIDQLWLSRAVGELPSDNRVRAP